MPGFLSTKLPARPPCHSGCGSNELGHYTVAGGAYEIRIASSSYGGFSGAMLGFSPPSINLG